MASKSTNSTIITVAMVVGVGFVAYKVLPGLIKKASGGSGANNAGTQVGGGYQDYGAGSYAPYQSSQNNSLMQAISNLLNGLGASKKSGGSQGMNPFPNTASGSTSSNSSNPFAGPAYENPDADTTWDDIFGSQQMQNEYGSQDLDPTLPWSIAEPSDSSGYTGDLSQYAFSNDYNPGYVSPDTSVGSDSSSIGFFQDYNGGGGGGGGHDVSATVADGGFDSGGGEDDG